MFSWHAIPFARLLLPFSIGILLSIYFSADIYTISILCGFLLLFLLIIQFQTKIILNYKLKLIPGIGFSLILILLGFSRATFYVDKQHPNYFTSIVAPKYYRLTIDDAVVEKTNYFRCYAVINSVIDSSDKQHSVHGEILLYIKNNNGFKKPIIGDCYLTKANAKDISAPLNPGEFNYKKYLGYHNVYFQQFSYSSTLIAAGTAKKSIYRTAVLLRDQSLVILKKFIPSQKELGVAEALLLGYKDDLDSDIITAFTRTGTLHVLAVSGLHAGIIYMILAFVLTPLSKKKYGKIAQVLLILFGIWLYAFMTGLSSSVLRASVMFSFMAIGKLLKYNVNIYNNIYTSAFLLLLYNPYYIMDVGFQLSYLAVLGIVFIQPLIAHWYVPQLRISRYIWGLISVSLAAQLLTFPISIYYFHQFPNYFLISNLLIIPVTSILLIALIALLLLHSVPIIGVLLGGAIYYLLRITNWLVQGIDQLPYSFTNGLNFDIYQMLMLYVILLLLLAFMIHQRKYLLFASLAVIIFFTSYAFSVVYRQNNQRILTIHSIKGHDVFTCIDGNKATIISDGRFISDEAKIKYFMESYFWSHGVEEIKKFNFHNSFVSDHIKNVKNVGFQFYDRILTIDCSTSGTVQKNGICLLKDPEFKNLDKFNCLPDGVRFSANTKEYKKAKIRQEFFERFKIKLKENKHLILDAF